MKRLNPINIIGFIAVLALLFFQVNRSRVPEAAFSYVPSMADVSAGPYCPGDTVGYEYLTVANEPPLDAAVTTNWMQLEPIKKYMEADQSVTHFHILDKGKTRIPIKVTVPEFEPGLYRRSVMASFGYAKPAHYELNILIQDCKGD